jgi:hypothetical protein
MALGSAARIFAAVIAAAAWVGLIVQLYASWSTTGSVLLAVWAMLAYFTILTNLLVAIVFTCIAINRGAVLRSNWIVAGTMLSILLVGIVFALLLRGSIKLSGGSLLANELLHVVTPALVPLFWVLFTRKGGLTRKHPLLWAIYPLAYLAYDMARGLTTGKYAYPFLNIVTLGWQRTALNAFLIAVAFMISGYAVVWVDNWAGSRRASENL